jgi:hypothetical protein
VTVAGEGVGGIISAALQAVTSVIVLPGLLVAYAEARSAQESLSTADCAPSITARLHSAG